MTVLNAIRKMTVEEFLALPESAERMELIDGGIVMSPKPTSDHQGFISYLSHLFFIRTGNKGRLIPDKEMIVQTADGREHIRCPDLSYIRESRREIVCDEAIRGPADIVIEILSESTEEVDRIAKRDEYQASGVTEYWIVDLLERAVLVHFFANGRQKVFQGEDSFESEVLKELRLPCQFSIPEIFEILR